MKMLRFSLLTLPGTLVAGWFTISCTPGADTPAATSACRIQQSTTTRAGQSLTSVNQTDYTYDQVGKLLKTVETSNTKPATGTFGTQTGTTTTTYTYDTDGYLTNYTYKRLVTTSGLNNASTSEEFTTVRSYSYTSGRLARTAESYNGTYATSPTPTINTYEYDTDGNLTRIRTNQQGDDVHQQISVYEKNTLVDYIGKAGASEVHPYTIQNGVVPKQVFPGTEQTLTILAQYDEQQRQIRNEEYVNDQLTQRIEQTWTNVKPASASLPLFKGIPVLRPTDAFAGQEGVLATRKSTYWNSVSKTMQPFNEQTSVVQANAQGYVTRVNNTITYAYATDQNTTVVTTYTYAGCQ